MENTVQNKVLEFFSRYKKQTYKKGEILIRADDDPSGIFYVTDGRVKEYAISRKGDELVVNIFKPFAFFPMSWAINNTSNSFFFEAAIETTVYKCPNKDVVAFIKSNPDVLFDLLSRVYKGTDGMLTRITYLMAGSAYSRLITEIIIQAKRFGTITKEGTVIKITEKDIASQSGMTRETVSREMKILKDKGLVTYQDNGSAVIKIVGLEDELVGGV